MDSANIIQLSAVCGAEEFDLYIKPRKSINKKASDVNQLTFRGTVLAYKGKPVSYVDLEEGLTQFLSFLEKFRKPVLVAHNGFAFDFPILCHEYTRVNSLEKLLQSVSGIADTLPVFVQTLPNLESHAQPFLVKTILKQEYDAHNSLADCTSLRQLVAKICSEEDDILVFSGTLSDVVSQIKHKQKIKLARSSLDPMVAKKSLSPYMANKMSKTGLFLEHISAAFFRGGTNGLAAVLQERDQEGKARVTDDPDILNKIVEFLETRSASDTTSCVTASSSTSALKANEIVNTDL